MYRDGAYSSMDRMGFHQPHAYRRSSPRARGMGVDGGLIVGGEQIDIQRRFKLDPFPHIPHPTFDSATYRINVQIIIQRGCFK